MEQRSSIQHSDLDRLPVLMEEDKPTLRYTIAIHCNAQPSRSPASANGGRWAYVTLHYSDPL
jgi:hypothetical protein